MFVGCSEIAGCYCFAMLLSTAVLVCLAPSSTAPHPLTTISFHGGSWSECDLGDRYLRHLMVFGANDIADEVDFHLRYRRTEPLLLNQQRYEKTYQIWSHVVAPLNIHCKTKISSDEVQQCQEN